MLRGIAVFALVLAATVAFASPALAGDAGMPPPPADPSAQPIVVPVSNGCCPSRNCCRRMHVEVEGHAALLTRDPEGLISVDSGRTDQARWDDIKYGAAFGGRAAVTVPWCRWDVTLAGTWWGSWDDRTDTSGSLTSTQTPGGPFGTTVFNDIPLHEKATLWDVNLVLSRPLCRERCFSSDWGFGLRYLRFDENADFTFDNGAVAPMPITLSDDINNGLLAIELMTSGTYRLNSCWDVTGTLSVFGGWMHRSASTATTALPPPAGADGTNNDFGFGGEVELALRWHPSRCWTVSVGYGLLALGNVTRAHRAFDFSNLSSGTFGPVFSDDTLWVHRFFAGVGLDF
jgi:hypothetical protein